jgi:hypothetical protein
LTDRSSAGCARTGYSRSDLARDPTIAGTLVAHDLIAFSGSATSGTRRALLAGRTALFGTRLGRFGGEPAGDDLLAGLQPSDNLGH